MIEIVVPQKTHYNFYLHVSKELFGANSKGGALNHELSEYCKKHYNGYLNKYTMYGSVERKYFFESDAYAIAFLLRFS